MEFVSALRNTSMDGVGHSHRKAAIAIVPEARTEGRFPGHVAFGATAALTTAAYPYPGLNVRPTGEDL